MYNASIHGHFQVTYSQIYFRNLTQEDPLITLWGMVYWWRIGKFDAFRPKGPTLATM